MSEGGRPPAPGAPGTEAWPAVAGFELLAWLGEGRSGRVYRARRVVDGVVVALKVFHPGTDAVDEEQDRFGREGRLLYAHPHPALVPVLGLGLEADPPWIAAGLMEGGDLAGKLAAEGPRPLCEVMSLGARLASALAHLHAQGVLHRDVKPANVLLDRQGQPFLGDLGLATAEAEGRLTRTGWVLGTPGYMAPELLEGSKASAAADVYALGVLLVEAATGRRPEPGAPGESAPPALATLVLGCLRIDPADRPEAGVLALELAEWGAWEPGEPVRGAGPDGATATLVPARKAAGASPTGGARSGPRAPGGGRGAILAGLALAVGMAALAFSRGGAERGVTGPPAWRILDQVEAAARAPGGRLRGPPGVAPPPGMEAAVGFPTLERGEIGLGLVRAAPGGMAYAATFAPRRFGGEAQPQRELGLVAYRPGEGAVRWRRLFVDDGDGAPEVAGLAADGAGVAAALVLPGPAGKSGVLLLADAAGQVVRVPTRAPPGGLALGPRWALVLEGMETALYARAGGLEAARVAGGPRAGTDLVADPEGVFCIGPGGEVLGFDWPAAGP